MNYFYWICKMSSFDKLYKEAAGVDDQAPAAPKPMTGTPLMHPPSWSFSKNFMLLSITVLIEFIFFDKKNFNFKVE
jgi:hypothetical protein